MSRDLIGSMTVLRCNIFKSTSYVNYTLLYCFHNNIKKKYPKLVLFLQIKNKYVFKYLKIINKWFISKEYIPNRNVNQLCNKLIYHYKTVKKCIYKTVKYIYKFLSEKIKNKRETFRNTNLYLRYVLVD